MSEFERPDRATREPTMADLRALMGASTPHFALQIRNRIATLIQDLPADHPVRVEGEREMERLEKLAFGGEDRGPELEGERPMPSVRLAEEKS
jgi:hypothetical protein